MTISATKRRAGYLIKENTTYSNKIRLQQILIYPPMFQSVWADKEMVVSQNLISMLIQIPPMSNADSEPIRPNLQIGLSMHDQHYCM